MWYGRLFAQLSGATKALPTKVSNSTTNKIELHDYLEIFIWSGSMESFLLLLAREGHWNIRWKVTVLPSSSAKLRQTNATSFPYPISSYLGTSLPGRIETPRWETPKGKKTFAALPNSRNLTLILCCSETVRDIDPSASGMMMQMVLSKDNRYAAAFTR